METSASSCRDGRTMATSFPPLHYSLSLSLSLSLSPNETLNKTLVASAETNQGEEKLREGSSAYLSVWVVSDDRSDERMVDPPMAELERHESASSFFFLLSLSFLSG